VTPELIEHGRALFTGSAPLANGGAPCAACHGFSYSGIAGGTLSVDLSKRVEIAGEQGFQRMLKNPNFPLMRNIYASRPLTDEEAIAMAAFAKDAVARRGSTARHYYPASGFGVFALLCVGLLLYKRRLA
jgi:hypothetical protein